MHCMTNNGIVKVVAFMENYLGKVSRATTKDISVGGIIIQIAEYLSFEINLAGDVVVDRKNKINMEALVHQGMIYMDGNTYTVMV